MTHNLDPATKHSVEEGSVGVFAAIAVASVLVPLVVAKGVPYVENDVFHRSPSEPRVDVLEVFDTQVMGSGCLDDTDYARGHVSIQPFTDLDMRGVDVTPTDPSSESVEFVYVPSPDEYAEGTFVAQATDSTHWAAAAMINNACDGVLTVK